MFSNDKTKLKYVKEIRNIQKQQYFKYRKLHETPKCKKEEICIVNLHLNFCILYQFYFAFVFQ